VINNIHWSAAPAQKYLPTTRTPANKDSLLPYLYLTFSEYTISSVFNSAALIELFLFMLARITSYNLQLLTNYNLASV